MVSCQGGNQQTGLTADGGRDGRGARARSRTAGLPAGWPEPAGAAGRGPGGGTDPGGQVRRAREWGEAGARCSVRLEDSCPVPRVSSGGVEAGMGNLESASGNSTWG